MTQYAVKQTKEFSEELKNVCFGKPEIMKKFRWYSGGRKFDSRYKYTEKFKASSMKEAVDVVDQNYDITSGGVLLCVDTGDTICAADLIQ